MADADTIIHLKTTSDNSGAKETEKALDGVSNAAKRTASETAQAHDKVTASAKRSAAETAQAHDKVAAAAERAAGGISKQSRESMNLRMSLGELAGVVSGKVKGAFTSLNGVINTAAKAIGDVTKALGVIGFAIQGVKLVIDACKALKEWLNRSKKEADELAKTLQDARIKASIDAAIASYIRLNGQIAETLRMEGERVKIANQLKANNRALEDAKIDNAEQTELNALDRNDPDYDARAALVSEKYRRKRADLKTSRDLADISERQDRLYADADTKTQQANAFDKEVEKTGERVIDLKRQIHAERDPERAKTLGQELDKLIDEQQKKIEAAKKLRQDASSMTDEALSLEGAKSAVILNGRTEGLRSDAAVSDANRKIALGQQQRAAAEAQKKAAEDARKAAEQDRAQKLAADRALVEAAPGRLDELRARIAGAQGQISAADENARAQAMDVARAQGQLDHFNRNIGTRRTGVEKERAGLEANVERETAEAQQASQAAAQLRSSLGELIAQLTAEIKALEGEVKAAKSRMNFQASEGGS